MATQVAICNIALRGVGSAIITSINDDNAQARILLTVWTDVRREVLAAHPWNFAKKRVALVVNETDPVFDFDYSYALPTDCVRVLRMEDDKKYEREGENLFTDESPAKIKYIYNVSDPSLFSPHFVTTLAVRLSSEIAYSLTGSQKVADDKLEEYKVKLKMAKSVDSQEGVTDAVEDTSWIDERA